MTKTIFDTSMSPDGFMAASYHAPEEPLGRRGLRLAAGIEGQGAVMSLLTHRAGGDSPAVPDRPIAGS